MDKNEKDVNYKRNGSRKFLILEKKYKSYPDKVSSITIRGIIESDYWPSRIQNDHEYSKKEYGVKYADVVEITDHCRVKLI